jgi:hypothetical protein
MARSLRFGPVLALAALVHLAGASATDANVVREWNAIAMQTITAAPAQNPFAQARTMSIVQLAVFEAVNAITGEYEPYLGTIDAPAGASAEAAAIAAAHGVLKFYVQGQAANLDAFLAASLLEIPDGSAKDDGIAVGEAAAAAMIALRTNDGSAPPAFYNPGPADPGLWQATPSCPTNPATGQQAGVFAHWGQMTPFAIPSAEQFMPVPPPAFGSNRYLKDYDEVARVGRSDSTDRPDDRATVAQFYASMSPSAVANTAARQLSEARGSTLSEDAQGFALINISINDALIVSFRTKYHYLLWRPETAIVRGDEDDNDKTDPDPTYVPYILTPCFPSYPSNHASGTSAGTEALRRIYGAAGHDITLVNPALPGVVLHYSILETIADDVDDARVYGGIHFRFDQVGGNQVGRAVATYVVKNMLGKVNGAH